MTDLDLIILFGLVGPSIGFLSYYLLVRGQPKTVESNT